MDIKNIPLNPLIALREKHKELIELTGYAGYKPEKIMRLYPDVKSPVHIEFPVESILHIELTCKDCGESTRITVYLQAETEIKLIEPIKAGGYNPHKYNPFGEVPQYPHLPFGQIPQFPRLPWNIFPNPACAERCIQAIARNQGYFVLVDGGRNTIRYVLTQEGKNALYNCLRRCGYFGALLISTWQEAIERLEEEATFSVGDEETGPPFGK